MTGHDARQAALAYLTGAATGGDAPAAIGRKFTALGKVLPFAGNTFLCHVPQGPAHAALVRAAQALQAGPLAAAFAFLPAASYHMTVFEGVTDQDRMGDAWPQGMDPALPVAQVTEGFLPRVATLHLPAVQTIRPTGLFAGFSLQVDGADATATAALRDSRARLQDATGIRRASFAGYGFHITLAYLLRWLTADEAETVLDLSDRVFADLAEAAPQIALEAVEFCSFADMHAFAPLRRLVPGG